LRFHDGEAGEILARNQLDVFLLPQAFQFDALAMAGSCDFRRKSMRAIGVSILFSRRSWRPPSKGDSRNASTIFSGLFDIQSLAAKTKDIRVVVLRAMSAVSSSETSAARIPGTLFAAMLMPTPEVQRRIPTSC